MDSNLLIKVNGVSFSFGALVLTFLRLTTEYLLKIIFLCYKILCKYFWALQKI